MAELLWKLRLSCSCQPAPLQGDVIDLLDYTGTQVVKYTYDAWGKPTSKSGTMKSTLGTVQPFRYRGYVYDEETGLYYLRSRYYDARLQKFLSPDSEIIQKQTLLCHHAYCYCANSPISSFDPNGTWFLTALATGVSAIVESTVGSAAVLAAVAEVAIAAVAVVATVAIVAVATSVISAISATIETVQECQSIANNIVSAVESGESIAPRNTYSNSIYVLQDSSNVVHYVGITNNVSRRAVEHRTDALHPQRANYKMRVVATGLSRPAARVGEQVLISSYTMDAIENARREIAVRNLPKFSTELLQIAELWKIDEIPMSLLN